MRNYTNKELNGFALIFAVVFMFILPPVSVFIKRNDFDRHFWLNVVLCFFGWLPAMIHSAWIVLFKED